MILGLILVSVGLLCASALAAPFFARSALRMGTTAAVLASALGATASIVAVVRGTTSSLTTPFASALGPLHVGLDPLSSFFLACVFVICGLAAVYGYGYLKSAGRPLAGAIAFFNLLAAAMAIVVLARDAIVFLLGWELMSIASFFLVTFDEARDEVRRAGTSYLIASHVGAGILVALFVVLSRATGSLAFDAWGSRGAGDGLRSLCFVLAAAGFGMKAGLWPMHVWLPEAHPAAPSHVSAVMSGVMIKMGIYGLIRILGFLGKPPLWWGFALIALGAVSGVVGVLHALAQGDLKRVLAYSSVENIGIITMGIGLGLIGKSTGHAAVSFLGYAGALLHVLNHGLFKGLLFQAAGSVAHATGTRALDALGGVGRRMPHTAAGFVLGSAAICGLPPLNGFVSEWLVYLAAFRGAASFTTAGAVAAVGVIVALALIGGLAAACFVRAYGMVFLGEPRSAAVEHAHEASRWMTGAMWTNGALCVVIGLGAPLAVRFVAPAVPGAAPGALGPLGAVTTVGGVLVATVGLLALWRAFLLRRRTVTTAPTWGCGYAEPTPRMQYTGASLAAPVLAPFELLFRREGRTVDPAGPFPQSASHEQRLGDRADHALGGLVTLFVRALARFGFLQRGRVQLYLLYVLATLVALLLWRAVSPR